MVRNYWSIGIGAIALAISACGSDASSSPDTPVDGGPPDEEAEIAPTCAELDVDEIAGVPYRFDVGEPGSYLFASATRDGDPMECDDHGLECSSPSSLVFSDGSNTMGVTVALPLEDIDLDYERALITDEDGLRILDEDDQPVLHVYRPPADGPSQLSMTYGSLVVDLPGNDQDTEPVCIAAEMGPCGAEERIDKLRVTGDETHLLGIGTVEVDAGDERYRITYLGSRTNTADCEDQIVTPVYAVARVKQSG